MSVLKGLAAKIFAQKSLAKEFDPESEFPIEDDDSQNGGLGSDSDENGQEDTKDTEHYVEVGKSKLRQSQPVPLGPAYRGVRISREQLDQGSDFEDEDEDGDEDEEDAAEFDDPDDVDLEGAEGVDSDDEIDSDDAFGLDDDALIKKFTFRGSSKPKDPNGDVDSDGEDDEDEDDEYSNESESNDGLELIEDEDGEDEDDEDGDEDDDNEEDAEEDEEVDAFTLKAQAETRRILAQERQQVLSSISQSAKADADKGFAVRQQRRTFDALLNMRIRMQKALSAANSLPTASEEDAGSVDDTALEDATEQTIELLISIQNIRKSFYAGDSTAESPSSKRKRNGDSSRSCQTIFDQMAQAEEAASAKRRKVLDRWATRVQRPSASSAAAASRRFMAPSAPQALTAVLDGQLVAPDRLIQKTRTPRSCAPIQAAKQVAEDPEIYDDADFYQLLLKELVDQRTVDTSAPGNAAPTVRWATAAAKEAKTRKQVDRKASKGRKMRFNVHEKLQNFMAAEDRRDWEPEAIDRFFGSLFGQRMELREDDGANDEDEDDEQTGGASLEEEGLRLFRS